MAAPPLGRHARNLDHTARRPRSANAGDGERDLGSFVVERTEIGLPWWTCRSEAAVVCPGGETCVAEWKTGERTVVDQRRCRCHFDVDVVVAVDLDGAVHPDTEVEPQFVAIGSLDDADPVAVVSTDADSSAEKSSSNALPTRATSSETGTRARVPRIENPSR